MNLEVEKNQISPIKPILYLKLFPVKILLINLQYNVLKNLLKAMIIKIYLIKLAKFFLIYEG